jgi:hypothetical protein
LAAAYGQTSAAAHSPKTTARGCRTPTDEGSDRHANKKFRIGLRARQGCLIARRLRKIRSLQVNLEATNSKRLAVQISAHVEYFARQAVLVSKWNECPLGRLGAAWIAVYPWRIVK